MNVPTPSPSSPKPVPRPSAPPTVRAECYHVGNPDPFPDTGRRLQAYAEAGADGL